MANTTGYGYLLGPAPQFFDANGKPLVGGKLFVYIAGTTTKAVTYSDFYKTENTNPVVLNDLGTCMLIVPSANLYKIVLYDRKGNLLITRDNVSVSSEQQIIYTTANKVDSSDSTVDVTATTDPDTGIITYDLSIKDEIDRAKEAEKGLADAIEAEKNRAEEAEKGIADAIEAEKNRAEEAERTISESISKETERAIAAEKSSRTEIVAGDNITVDKTTGEDGHDIYTINGEKGGTEGVFGAFSRNGDVWDRYKGDADIANLKQGNYHYTILIRYYVSPNAVSNKIAEIQSAVGLDVHRALIDMSYEHSDFVEFSGDFYGTSLNPTVEMPSGVTSLHDTCLFVHSTAGGGSGSGGGSGDNDKVAVESGAVAGFLKDVLVSASDMVTLVPNGNRLMVNVNLDYSSDPKLETMNESQVDGATENYGGYQLKSGATKLLWDDDAFQSYSWLNAKIYQCMRLSDAQGTITKCNVALCGTLAFSNPSPCFNIGIFDALTGTLLGQSGLKFYGEDFNSNEEMVEVNMVEAYAGALDIKRNTRYIVQVWTCGLQLAGLDRSSRYNYAYDYTLRQNLETTTSSPKFVDPSSSMNRAAFIPMVSFGAESLS